MVLLIPSSVKLPIDVFKPSLDYEVDSFILILTKFVSNELEYMFEVLENINTLLYIGNLVPNNPFVRVLV